MISAIESSEGCPSLRRLRRASVGRAIICRTDDRIVSGGELDGSEDRRQHCGTERPGLSLAVNRTGTMSDKPKDMAQMIPMGIYTCKYTQVQVFVTRIQLVRNP